MDRGCSGIIRIGPVLFIAVFIGTVSSVLSDPIATELATGDTTLTLNGSGFRTAFGIRLYQSGLYLQQRNNDPDFIINDNAPMAVRMIILSSLITAKRLSKSTSEGFLNATNGNLDSISAQVNRFLSLVVEDLKKNDVFTFIYRPQQGTQIIKNGIVKGVIPGLAFKEALFGIWLCQKPPAEELKNSMLGK